ncbi:hypothetical protein RJ641_030593 [Dillenia turbinata]|uniref:RRM domain-containing protein n=1 Tax=Dillenia turbinata TaxID=194707 RepID=A0AAN8W3X6_9MAGN
MKSRIRSSILTLLSGESRSTSSAISLRPMLKCFSLDSKGGKKVRFMHSESDDDEFAELGAPVDDNLIKVLKLATEKRIKSPFEQRNDCNTKNAAGRYLSKESRSSVKDFQPTHVKNRWHNPCRKKTEKQTDNLGNNSNSMKHSNNKSRCSITVENVPSTIKISELKLAVSTFGKITHASMESLSDELSTCSIEFETVESSRLATTIGRISVRGFHLFIRPKHVADSVAVRISNINPETTDQEIHTICTSLSPLVGLVRTKEDAAHALFSAKVNLDPQSILQELNNVDIGNSHWSAELLLSYSTSAVITDNSGAQSQLGKGSSSHLADMRLALHMKAIYFEDLQRLHHALLYLEANNTDLHELPDS